MADKPEANSFLERWSQRKAKSRQDELDNPVDEDVSALAETEADAGDEAEETTEETSEEQGLSDSELCERYELPHPEECTDPEELDGFFSRPLPDRLKQLAMRRMWRINPLFKFADEMVEYGENYTDAATVIPDMQTAYKVGKGYLDKILAEQKEKEQTEALELAAAEAEEQNSLSAKPDASQPDEQTLAESRDAQADNRPDKTTTPDDADTGEERPEDIAGENIGNNTGENTGGEEETGQHPDSSTALLRQETELIHHAEKLPQRPGETEELLPQNRPRPRRMVFTKKQENT